MTARILLDPGDCFTIPLADGRFAHGQYLRHFEEDGCLIRVFDVISGQAASMDQLRTAAELFPPVFVGLNPPIREGRWKRIGNFDIAGYSYPRFRWTLLMRPGKHTDWRLWDPEKKETTFIGELPEELRTLENLAIWSYGDLEKRILTGRNQFFEEFF